MGQKLPSLAFLSIMGRIIHFIFPPDISRFDKPFLLQHMFYITRRVTPTAVDSNGREIFRARPKIEGSRVYPVTFSFSQYQHQTQP